MQDLTMQAVEFALNGLAARADVTANNIANASLPGFRPSRVSFENQLASALRSGDADRLGDPSMSPTLSVPNGTNEVALEDEVVDMIRTGLLRDSMVAAYNFKASQLRNAIRGGA